MNDLARLGIHIDSDDAPVAVRRLNRFAGEARKADRAANTLERSTDSMGRAYGQAARMIALASAAVGSMSLALRSADRYTGMINGLRGMGQSADQAAASLNSISEIARNTRAPLEATAKLYQRISVASAELGATQQEVFRFTENIGLALGAAGVGANEASGALLQLSQAMAGGVVRAEEFNSILEGAFPIALAAAQGIDAAGGSVGRLRQLVVDGKVSSDAFFNAILSQSEQLGAAFANTAATIAQAFGQLNDSFTLFVGRVDQATGVTAAIAEGILFLADNIDRIIVTAGTAAVAFGGAYVAAMVLAAAKTATLSGALVFLRGALIRTGIGVTIVAAGELVYQFSRLISGAGGFGKAMRLLGNLAQGVWEQITAGGAWVVASLNIHFNDILYNWTIVVNRMLEAWARFQDSLAGSSVGEMLGLEGGNYERVFAEGTQRLTTLTDALGTHVTVLQKAEEALEGPVGGWQDLKDAVSGGVDELKDGSSATERAAVAMGDLDKATGGAAGATQSAVEALREQIREERELIGLSDRAKAEIEARREVERALAQDQTVWSDAQIDALKDQILLNQQLRQEAERTSEVTRTIFDSIASGDIRSLGAGLLSQAQSSFSGLLQKSFGAGGGGFSDLLGSFKDSFSGIGSALSGPGGFFGKIGGAISAALPVIGAVSAVFSFFKKTVEELDAGIRVTTSGMDALVETFRTTRTTRFWGLSKKTSTGYDVAERELSDPIQSAITDIGERVLALSDVLGLASDNLNKTSFEFEVSTKDKTDEQIQAAIEAEMVRLGDTFADAVIGSYTEFLPDEAEIARLEKQIGALANSELIGGPGEDRLDAQRAQLETARVAAETAVEITHLNEQFADLQREGEGSLDLLERLVSELSGVNDMLTLFGRELLSVDVAGAAAASKLVELSGGLEDFAAKSDFIFANFLTDTAQNARLTEIALDQLNTTFAGLSMAIPETHDEFMALLEAQDLTTDAGRQTYAALQDVAAAFVQVSGTAQEAADAQAAAIARTDALVQEMLDNAAQAALDAINALDAYNRDQFTRTTNAQIDTLNDGFDRLSDTLNAQIDLARSAVDSAADALRTLTGAINSRTPQESATASEARSEAAVASLMSSIARGTLPGAEALSRIVGDISDNPEAFATREDYLRDFARTNAVLEEAQAMASATLTTEERMLAALEQRLTDAASQNDSVVAGLQEQINALRDLPVSLAGVLPTGQLSDNGTNALFTDADIQRFSELSVQINDLYNSILGRNADVQGLNFYLQQITDGLTLSGVASDLRSSIEANTGNTPGFNGNPVQNVPTQPTDPVQTQAELLAIANGTAAFGGRPTDFIGNLYGSYGIPISRAGYDFWSGLVGTMSNTALQIEFLRAAQRDGNFRSVPAYRTGTSFHPGGLAYVHSDELINMPRGSSVSTASETRRMFDNTEMVNEIRELRREVARLRSENNQGLSEIEREANRTSKVLRDWDENGQAPERTS